MKEFTAYLQSKDLATVTQTAYLLKVNLFLNWYNSPTQKEIINTEKKDILNYLEYLQTTKKQANVTRRNTLIALHHYFTFLAKTGVITTVPTTFLKLRGTQKRHLYNNYSTEELTQLYDDFYHTFIRNFNDNHVPENQQKQAFLSRQRNYIMLGMLIYQGLQTNELQNINLEDIDLNKATLKITGNKKSNERTLNLNASQIGTLIHYINIIRPQFLAFLTTESEQLFFTLPESSKSKTDNKNLMNVFYALQKQIRSIDQKFLRFRQIRTSVITHWIKTLGLRKAQYLAGHRYISSTEKYVPNNLENLTEDITKFNPF